MSQRSFAIAEYALKKRRTRRDQFLGEMERIVPWSRRVRPLVAGSVRSHTRQEADFRRWR